MSKVEGLEYSENLVEKARNLVENAEKELQKCFGTCSNVVLSCQQATELCAKAIFKATGLDFPKEHQLLFDQRKKVRPEVIELLKKEFPKNFVYRDKIPRIIFLTYFWHSFYAIAKYGLNDANIPPDKLFSREDAELALKHAKECIEVADNLLIQKELRKENNSF